MAEFLSLMQPRHKKAIWSNEDAFVQENTSQTGLRSQNKKSVDLVDGENASDDEYEDVEKAAATDGDVPGSAEDNDVDGVVVDAGVSDLDYLKSRMTSKFSDDEDELEGSGEEPASGAPAGAQQDEDAMAEGDQKSLPPAQEGGTDDVDPNDTSEMKDEDHIDQIGLISKTRRLFARNLPYSAGDDDVRNLFEQYGDLEEVHIVIDKATRKSKGYALVTFVEPGCAVKAFEVLDGSIFMGRLLHILPGKSAPRHEDGVIDDSHGTSSYKKEKETKMKKEEATNRAAWNTLFMRADTVADAVADMYDMPKSALLDPSASDMAVRLALGEVKIINMTKEHLEEHGVRVSTLEDAAQSSGKSKKRDTVKRSDCVLIVKNLPYTLDEDELKSMFSSIGPVLRWVLPPSHALAIVEFSSSHDATNAFKKLAFKRYRSVPIYLEWAPWDIFSHDKSTKSSIEKTPMAPDKSQEDKTKVDPVGAALTSLQNGTDDSTDSSTIFVKNIAFKTKRQSFEKHFRDTVRSCGGEMKSAKIAQRKLKDGKQVSAGFGFVECSSEDVARRVIDALQASSLDGHNLVLQLSQAAASSLPQDQAKKAAPDTKAASSKVLIRNVAFEATRADLVNLFTPFGEVKSCRLPRKFDGNHRGFAFLEFASKQEAKAAVAAVAGSHLYGRRLVIEWAEEDDSVDQIREKTSRKFDGGQSSKQKRVKSA